MAREPKAEVEITAHSRGLGARLREAGAKFRKFGGELKKNAFGKDFAKEGFGTKVGAHLVANLGSSAISATANFLVDQAKAAYQFERGLTRLQIVADKSPEYMRAFADSVRAASDETGIGKEKILAGARAYVALTGDMDGAAAATRQWARVAQATDSNVEDIAATAAALKQNMKIDPSDMEAVFSALNVEGKKGAIELKDLAAQLSTIAPQWAQFGRGTGVQAVREMGAALQIVKRGFGGDASETVTGLQSLLTSLSKKKFSGVKIWEKDPKTGHQQLRNVLDIVKDISVHAEKTGAKITPKTFGRVEAYRAFIQLRDNRDELKRFIDEAQDSGSIARDLNTYLQSSAGKMETGWERAKNKIAEAFTPERIDKFAEALGKAAEMFADIIGATEKIVHFIAEDVGVGDEDRQQMVKGIIQGNTVTDDMMRKAIGADNGVDLQSMSPADRAKWLSAHAKEVQNTLSLGEQNVHAAVGDIQRGSSYDVIRRAQEEAKDPWLRRTVQPGPPPSGKVDPQAAQQLTAALANALGPKLDAMIKALNNGQTNVKIGSDTVAKAVKTSPQNAKKPGA